MFIAGEMKQKRLRKLRGVFLFHPLIPLDSTTQRWERYIPNKTWYRSFGKLVEDLRADIPSMVTSIVLLILEPEKVGASEEAIKETDTPPTNAMMTSKAWG